MRKCVSFGFGTRLGVIRGVKRGWYTRKDTANAVAKLAYSENTGQDKTRLNHCWPLVPTTTTTMAVSETTDGLRRGTLLAVRAVVPPEGCDSERAGRRAGILKFYR